LLAKAAEEEIPWWLSKAAEGEIPAVPVPMVPLAAMVVMAVA